MILGYLRGPHYSRLQHSSLFMRALFFFFFLVFFSAIALFYLLLVFVPHFHEIRNYLLYYINIT